MDPDKHHLDEGELPQRTQTFETADLADNADLTDENEDRIMAGQNNAKGLKTANGREFSDPELAPTDVVGCVSRKL
jgi:hypothetical protein